MTYNTNVPVASQTPSLFPAQGTANFTVLKQTIGRDHIFNNTVASGDNTGYHKQVTLQNRNNPSSLPTGLNAVLFSQKAAPNASQLMFWDGTIFNQLTPVGTVIPLLITGKLSLTAGASTTILADPGYNYVATTFTLAQGTTNSSLDMVSKSGPPNNAVFRVSNTGNVDKVPEVLQSGNDLTVRNDDSVTRVIQWSITINKSP